MPRRAKAAIVPRPLPPELLLCRPWEGTDCVGGVEVARLTRDDIALIVSALDSHAYWQLADESNRNSGYVMDTEESKALTECQTLHDRIEALLMRMPEGS